ncbi:MAG TPA: HAD-IA family hydrolase [Gemmatimonadaceae bacterium]|nr:HAD-IA family hydrolase [Gemmatimonadaceae bacterium]
MDVNDLGPRAHAPAGERPGPPPITAALLDLDGVLTRTAVVHAAAWQATFDPDADYRRYVDGKPREAGVRDFLASRGLALPEGAPDDPPERDTVWGVGARKNARFHALLAERGVPVAAGAPERLQAWRTAGLRLAVVTSSRNGRVVLERAGLADAVELLFDGTDRARLGLRGKPAPDSYLAAARALGVPPARAAVVEDAIAGIEAGRRGGFGLVVGIAADETGAARLRAAGADLVAPSLAALPDPPWAARRAAHPIETERPARDGSHPPPSAHERSSG